MSALVTYDVSSKQAEVKKKLVAKGYQDRWPSEGKQVYLPDTTLWHESKTPAEARDDVTQVAKELSVTLERCVAVMRSDNWAAIFGAAHA